MSVRGNKMKMELFKTETGWNVTTDNPEVMELFGTDTLPTGYTARADAGRVVDAIRALNPGADVRLKAIA